MKDVKRYSRGFNGEMTKDPFGPWVLVGDACEHEKLLIAKLAAETLRADTAEAELKKVKGLLEEALGSVYAEGRRAETAFASRLVLGLADRIEAALNPKPEAGSDE